MESLSPSVIVEFIHYNNWANQRILEVCRGLDEDQLAFNAPGTFGTIRATLVHIIRAEAGYVSLLTGSRPKPSFEWDANPGLSEMTEYSKKVGDALVQAALTVRPTDVIHQHRQDETINYKAIVLMI